MASQKELIKTTCPRDCYDRCGIVVIKRDGAITKVAGDPAHPINRGPLCGKCAIAYNGAWRDAGRRLLHPLRRAGPKGSGAFEPISWEAALREIAGKLTAIRDAHGAETIFHTHYTGTCPWRIRTHAATGSSKRPVSRQRAFSRTTKTGVRDFCGMSTPLAGPDRSQ